MLPTVIALDIRASVRISFMFEFSKEFEIFKEKKICEFVVWNFCPLVLWKVRRNVYSSTTSMRLVSADVACK